MVMKRFDFYLYIFFFLHIFFKEKKSLLPLRSDTGSLNRCIDFVQCPSVADLQNKTEAIIKRNCSFVLFQYKENWGSCMGLQEPKPQNNFFHSQINVSCLSIFHIFVRIFT